MGCQSQNATAPSPPIAPGIEHINERASAEAWARRGLHESVLKAIAGMDAPFFQAGLAGYSDAAMRLIARRHGCPLCVTEALLDRTLLAGGRGFAKADLGEIADNVPFGSEDRPLVGQIMGSEPAEMAAAAVKMIEQGARGDRAYRSLAYDHDPALLAEASAQHLRAPGGEQVGRMRADLRSDPPAHAAQALRFEQPFVSIDVNLACPVKKIRSKARGGHWLAEPVGAIRLLQAVRDALPDGVAVSVKMRRSFDDTPEMARNFLRIFDAAYDLGCAWVTVHARTVEQKYLGPSRWDLLRGIVRHARQRAESTGTYRPVFGSGDVWDAPSIFRMIAYAGVDAVSVARGCIGNPWIFRQARAMMRGDPMLRPTVLEQRGVLLDHFRLALAVNHGARDAQSLTGTQMRKFAIRFAEHHPQRELVRRAFISVSTLEEWIRVLDAHYGNDQPSVAGEILGIPA